MRLFHDAQVVVLPHLEATQSGVAAFALGMGRAVIASNTGAIPELVAASNSGLLVEPGNPHRLASGLRKLLEDQALCRNLARNARESAEGELSWRRIAEATTAVYERAREGRAASEARASATRSGVKGS